MLFQPYYHVFSDTVAVFPVILGFLLILKSLNIYLCIDVPDFPLPDIYAGDEAGFFVSNHFHSERAVSNIF